MIRDGNMMYYSSMGYGKCDKTEKRMPKTFPEKIPKDIQSEILDLKRKKYRLNFEHRSGMIDDETYGKTLHEIQDDIQFWLEEAREEIGEKTSHKKLKRSMKKNSDEKVEEEILEIINEEKPEFLTKEDVAMRLQVKESQVEKIFMKLNREKILKQPLHKAPHDSCRDPWGGFENCKMWMSDIYYIRKD